MTLSLVIFDVDGTLVDSQGHIVAAMTHAFEHAGRPVPSRDAILSIVGLSLEQAMMRLDPAADAAQLAQGYRDGYHQMRLAHGAAASSPLYPGARAALDRLAARDDLLLAVATGKSRRGLNALVEAHGLDHHFISRQTADDHPSKPHPSMIMTILAETGVAPAHTVMVGDTSYDMDMGRAAGVKTIGVPWGYHPVNQLAADAVITNFAELDAVADRLIGAGK